MPKMSRFLCRYQRCWLAFLLGLFVFIIGLNPATAQTNSSQPLSKANIVLDGKNLFEVGNNGNVTATQRAEKINRTLKQQVHSLEAIELEVVGNNQQAMIREQASQQPLLTVSEADIFSADSVVEQAEVWRDRLEAALEQGHLERSPTYLVQAWIYTIGAFLGALALHVSLQVLDKLGSRQIARRLGNPTYLYHWEQSAKLFWRLALLGLQIGLWTAVIWYITDIFPDARSLRHQLFKLITSRIFHLGNSSYSALELLLLLAFTVGLWFVVRGITLLLKTYVLSKIGADTSVQEVVTILAQYILTFLGLIVLWQFWGLDIASLAIVGSVLGVGIGFGLQNITNNLISGLIITLERPIQVGDFVNVSNFVGTVQRIGSRSTEIRTLDQVSIIVPNSRFLESEIINWTHSDPISRLRIPVGVAYGSETATVKTALLEAAKSHPDVLVSPRPLVSFQEFGDSSLNFELLVWTGDPKSQFRLKSDLHYLIDASLRRYRLSVPFPQRDLHLRSPQLDRLLAALPQPKLTEPPVLSLSQETTITDTDHLVHKLRSPQGIEIKDRYYCHNIYQACFIGSEAVSWLVQEQNCTREEAIATGQFLVEQGIIHHVIDKQTFQDGFFFYRFYADEKKLDG